MKRKDITKKVLKLLDKREFGKAEKLISNKDNIIDNDKLTERAGQCYYNYNYVNTLVSSGRCTNQQLLNDFMLYQESAKDNYDDAKIEQLLKAGANPDKSFSCQSVYREISGVADKKEILFLCMKHGFEINKKIFNGETYIWSGEKSELDDNFSLINTYETPSRFLTIPFLMDLLPSNGAPTEEDCENAANTFKQHLLAARYGIAKQLQAIRKTNACSNKVLEDMKTLDGKLIHRANSSLKSIETLREAAINLKLECEQNSNEAAAFAESIKQNAGKEFSI